MKMRHWEEKKKKEEEILRRREEKQRKEEEERLYEKEEWRFGTKACNVISSYNEKYY